MISVVIPVYNEEDTVEKCIIEVENVLAHQNAYEIITVNDGSTDGSLEKLTTLGRTHSKLKVLTYSKNLGPGNAFRVGFQNAKGDIIVTMDCDMSFSPKYIRILLSEVKDADVVIGSQHARGASMRNIPLIRLVASKVAVFLDRKILNVPLSTLSSFLVAYRREVIKSIKFEANGFDAQCEILTKICRAGYKIKEVPCVLEWSEKRRRRGVSINKLISEAKKRVHLWKRLRHYA